jgi:hypothetical protein
MWARQESEDEGLPPGTALRRVHWHIDGTRQRQYHGFTLLMGVALSDCGYGDGDSTAPRSGATQESGPAAETAAQTEHTAAGADDSAGDFKACGDGLEGNLCVWPQSHHDLMRSCAPLCEPGAVDYDALAREGVPLQVQP